MKSTGEMLLKFCPALPWRVNHFLRSQMGILPDFLIAGFPKCGTTSLYNYLIQHSQILPAENKEVWYFSTFPLANLPWYKFRFPYRLDKFLVRAGIRKPFLAGEASPDYLFRRDSIQHIHQTIPSAKIIVLVRNPIMRSYSYYQHEKRAGRIHSTFEELVDYEYERFCAKGLLQHEELYEQPQLKDTFLLGSLYYEYVKVLYEYFGKAQVRVVASESLFSRPEECVGEVLQFLELPEDSGIKFMPYNQGSYDRTQIPKMSFLKEFYKPYNEKLEKLIDRELNW